MTHLQAMDRRTFLKGLVAVGVAATLPHAEAYVENSKTINPDDKKGGLHWAVWEMPDGRFKMSRFTGDVPSGARSVKTPRFDVIWMPLDVTAELYS